jgi:Uma2 family endonuclease
MAHVALITSTEYDRLYASESGWEFWFGEARRKPIPTQFHGILQLLLGYLLKMAGYRASTETELRIIPDWYPRPDVTGIQKGLIERYPTEPVDVVFEVLSEGEEVIEKCRLYAQIGIRQVFYFDPELRRIYVWRDGALIPTTDVQLANGSIITGKELWAEFEFDLNRLIRSRHVPRVSPMPA